MEQGAEWSKERPTFGMGPRDHVTRLRQSETLHPTLVDDYTPLCALRRAPMDSLPNMMNSDVH